MFYLYNGDLSHYSNHVGDLLIRINYQGTTRNVCSREDDSGQGDATSGFGTNKLDEKMRRNWILQIGTKTLGST